MSNVLRTLLTPAAAVVLCLGLPAVAAAQSAQSPNAREARESRGQTPLEQSVDNARDRERDRDRFRPPESRPRPEAPRPEVPRPEVPRRDWDRPIRPDRPDRPPQYGDTPRRPYDPGRWEQRRPDDDPPPRRPGWRPDEPRWRPSPPPPVWHRPVPVLPPHARSYHYRGDPYWYFSGRWYRPYGSSYVVVRPPAGLWISTLPPSYRIVQYGPSTYYYADEVYYSAVPTGGYEVVEPPQQVAPLYQPPIAYPAAGQTPQQQANDEYECHLWAVQQSGFDPSSAAVGQAGRDDEVLRGNYTRAYIACLEGRGYTVR